MHHRQHQIGQKPRIVTIFLVANSKLVCTLTSSSSHSTPFLSLLQTTPIHSPPSTKCDHDVGTLDKIRHVGHPANLHLLPLPVSNPHAYSPRSSRTLCRVSHFCSQTSMLPTYEVYCSRRRKSDGTLIQLPTMQALVTLHTSTPSIRTELLTAHMSRDFPCMFFKFFASGG